MKVNNERLQTTVTKASIVQVVLLLLLLGKSCGVVPRITMGCISCKKQELKNEQKHSKNASYSIT